MDTAWRRRTGTVLAIGIAAALTGLTAPATAHTDRAASQPVRLQPDLGSRTHFGSAVSMDGDTLLVGAPEDDVPDNRRGSAWVYATSGGTWVNQARLVASDGTAGDAFGYSVSVDGDTALVGAPYDSSFDSWSGVAYVFERSGSSWTEQAKLVPSVLGFNSRAGWAVAVQGDVAAVGLWGASAGSSQGAVSIFTRSGETWTETAVLTDPVEGETRRFGAAVALDGDTLVVGVETPSLRAAAFVYVRSEAGWTLQSELTTAIPSRDRFGGGVDIDGDRIVVSAKEGTVDGVELAGSAYVFERSGSTWQETAHLVPPKPHRNDFFGHDVSVAGRQVVISSVTYPNELNQGAVYAYRLRSDDTWGRPILVRAPEPTTERFGHAVDLDETTGGMTMTVGAPNHEEPGAAFVYRR